MMILSLLDRSADQNKFCSKDKHDVEDKSEERVLIGNRVNEAHGVNQDVSRRAMCTC